ncbi:NDMA-dependent alcohol dehydrogenase [Mycolicibacterium thermoresistibile]
MRTHAAVLWEAPGRWQIEELEVGEPGRGDVQIRIEAAGLCHSDYAFNTGDSPVQYFPWIGGHEGAGVVTAVGADVRSVAVGDHVVTVFIPSCGVCRWCSSGQGNLCDEGARIMALGSGEEQFRIRTTSGQGVGQTALLGTFSQWTSVPEQSVIKIPDDVPFNAACLLACGVPTGWGAAVNAGNVSPGDVVVVMGTGGIGMNSVQGAKHAGAAHILAIDPSDYKQAQALEFGATESYADIGAASARLAELTNGQGADVTLVSVDLLTSDIAAAAVESVRKAGTVVITSLGRGGIGSIPVDLMMFPLYQKRIQGSLFGAQPPRVAVPRLLELYRSGDLKIDELVTQTYRLEDINEAYEDVQQGKVIRPVIDMAH